MSQYIPKLRRSKGASEGFQEESQAQEHFFKIMRANAGAGSYACKDPVYALSESFSQTFDLVGKQAARMVMGAPVQQMDQQDTDMSSYIANDTSQYLQRFTQYAFQNGRLAGAILQGQGRMALHACISRSAGMAGMTDTVMRRRVEANASRRKIQQGVGWVDFGADAHAAVALVADTTRTATQLLEDIRKASNQIEGKQVTTLREIFPFLFDQEDRELIAQLEERRRQMQSRGDVQSAQYRAVDASLNKARAVLQKKAQMRRAFLDRLDLMLESARAAERMYSDVSFLDTIEFGSLQTEQPEENNNAEKSDQTGRAEDGIR